MSTAAISPGVETYLKAFDASAQQRKQEPAWLRTLRQRAIDRFAELGFPSTRDEQWKFTSVEPLAARTFTRPDGRGPDIAGAALAPYGIGVATALQIVFVNGRFAPGLSTLGGLPAGVEVTTLSSLLARDGARAERYVGRFAAYHRQSFVALNTALFDEGVFVSVAPDLVLERPIHLLHVSTAAGQMAHPRVLIVAGDHSQAHPNAKSTCGCGTSFST